MSLLADFSVDHGPEGAILRFSGRLTLARIADLPERIAQARDSAGQFALLDLTAVERVDTVGAWLLNRLVAEDGARIQGASPEALRLMEAVDAADEPVRIRPDTRSPFLRVIEEVGRGVSSAFAELARILGFFGATIVTSFTLLRHPGRLRWNAIVTRFETVGVNALAIIGLMSFLIGIVIAQQGAVQLRQFGMEIFTINLVGRASVRELGLLMTGIMVAGRSGSAFAAQIGTMKLTEEVDAMRTIGVSPMEAIVLPRVFAATLMMPLLGFYASICAIVGGGIFCWVGLEIPPLTYISLLRDIIPMTDFWIMMIKAPVFGMLIGITGCYEGMQVRQNAEEVGSRTTSAVVSAIFLVIVLDAFFAVFFTSLGWN